MSAARGGGESSPPLPLQPLLFSAEPAATTLAIAVSRDESSPSPRPVLFLEELLTATIVIAVAEWGLEGGFRMGVRKIFFNLGKMIWMGEDGGGSYGSFLEREDMGGHLKGIYYKPPTRPCSYHREWPRFMAPFRTHVNKPGGCHNLAYVGLFPSP